MNNIPIDIVYTWVNGNDQNYQALYRRHAETYSDINPERYRDIYSSLKYSLRSVEQSAQWVRFTALAKPIYSDILPSSISGTTGLD